MALRFDPSIYRQEPEEENDGRFIMDALSSLGSTFQNIGQNRRQDEQMQMRNQLAAADLTDKYGTVGARRILRPTEPPKRILGQSSHVNMGQPMPVGNQPLESFDLEQPDQFSQARRMYGSSGVQPHLEARKYGMEMEDRDLSRKKTLSEIEKNNRAYGGGGASGSGLKLPTGYRWTADGMGMEPIPGGPATQKQDDKRSDLEATLNLYNTARQGLLDGLRGTNTGPIAGRLPALTSGQQIAEGAVAAMAPVLKQLFRVSGEGVFTDRDQALLLDMIPTRTTHPEAYIPQIENIDRIVKAKLRAGPTAGSGMAPAAGDGKIRVRNRQTGQTGSISPQFFNEQKYERLP